MSKTVSMEKSTSITLSEAVVRMSIRRHETCRKRSRTMYSASEKRRYATTPAS